MKKYASLMDEIFTKFQSPWKDVENSSNILPIFRHVTWLSEKNGAYRYSYCYENLIAPWDSINILNVMDKIRKFTY